MAINHLVSSKKKDAKKDNGSERAWFKTVTDKIIGSTTVGLNNNNYLDTLYLAAKGQLNKEAYNDVLGRIDFLKEDSTFSQFEFDSSNDVQEKVVKQRTGGGGAKGHPVTIKNYDILYPVINSIVGTRSEVPINGTVVVKNADYQTMKEQFKKDQMYEKLITVAARKLKMLSGDAVDSEERQEINLIEEEKKLELSYKDIRALQAQTALNVVIYEESLKDKYQNCLYDYVVCEHAITLKEIVKDDIKVEDVDPRCVYYSAGDNCRYLEDADEAYIWKRMTMQQIVHRFNEHLSKEDIEWLQKETENGRETDLSADAVIVYNEADNSWRNYRGVNKGFSDRTFDVYFVFFKTLKKVGTLEYVSPFGQIEETIVDEYYKLDTENGDIKVSWTYVTETRCSYRISDKIYINGGAIKAQRNEYDNYFSGSKLPINGIIPDPRVGTIQSIVSIGLNYQILYNVYHWRLERTISKHKDKIMIMAKGLIPPGWTAKKWMYFLEMDNIMWVDESHPKAPMFLQAIRTIDMSLGQYISELRAVLGAIKQEFWDNIGFVPQRLGQVQASATASGTQQAVDNSYTVNGELYRKIDKLIEKDLQGLIDFAKVAWKDGKKGVYLDSDFKEVFYEIDGEEFSEIEAGVYVKESMKEKEILDKAREFTQAYIQNNLPPDASIDVLTATNTSELKRLVKEASKKEREYQESIQKEEQKMQQDMQQAQIAEARDERIFKESEALKDRIKDIRIALIKSESSMAGAEDTQSPNIDNSSQVVELKNMNKVLNDLERERAAIEKEKIKAEALRYKATMDYKIAKENKNKYDSKTTKQS